jgi:hypothetical protein
VGSMPTLRGFDALPAAHDRDHTGAGERPGD